MIAAAAHGPRYWTLDRIDATMQLTAPVDQLAGLGGRLKLPEGWTFSSRAVEADLEVRDVDGIAVVVQDPLENTYQLKA